MAGTVANPIGITNPPIDELLANTDSKYSLVIYALAVHGREVKARNVSEAAARLGWSESATDWKDVVNRDDVGMRRDVDGVHDARRRLAERDNTETV